MDDERGQTVPAGQRPRGRWRRRRRDRRGSPRAFTDPPTRGRIERVKELQRQLSWLGLEPGLIDGRYGPLTTGAVKRFQEAHDLIVDGVVGQPRPKPWGRARRNARPPIGSSESGRYSSSSARSGSSPGRSTAAMARRRRTRSSGSSRATTWSPTGSSIRSRSTPYRRASSSTRIEASQPFGTNRTRGMRDLSVAVMAGNSNAPRLGRTAPPATSSTPWRSGA